MFFLIVSFLLFGVLASKDGARVRQLNLCYDLVDKRIINHDYRISHSLSPESFFLSFEA